MATQRVTIQELLARARVRYRRLSPRQAYEAMRAGALLIDVRDGDQQLRDGVIPGALMIDRTVLEWRVDPASGAADPAITSLDGSLILIFNQGYSSSLAVASLLDLGATRATDVIGGFQGWRAAGLPVCPVPPTGP